LRADIKTSDLNWQALALCNKHKATLLIARLDRLARNNSTARNVGRGGIEYDDNLHFICCAASFRLLRQPAANHGADGLADRRAGRDGGDLKSSRSCTHRLALPFVAEPQQRHQHEGKGSEGGRYQNQRRQLVMQQMIEQE
jgi:hypothetical protein